jgi:hypothetical protein
MKKKLKVPRLLEDPVRLVANQRCDRGVEVARKLVQAEHVALDQGPKEGNRHVAIHLGPEAVVEHVVHVTGGAELVVVAKANVRRHCLFVNIN